jgi:uncharacterized membrane protein YadS
MSGGRIDLVQMSPRGFGVWPGSAAFSCARCEAKAAEVSRSPGRWRVHHVLNRLLALLPALLFVPNTCIPQETKLKSDEQIVFYPGVAQRLAGATNLRL